ncbi:MAG: hypothetical protein FWH29_09155 [Methanobrevibacter sp.]|nr:hypothetical protein [Methanobrevibacter sp.]
MVVIGTGCNLLDDNGLCHHCPHNQGGFCTYYNDFIYEYSEEYYAGQHHDSKFNHKDNVSMCLGVFILLALFSIVSIALYLIAFL